MDKKKCLVFEAYPMFSGSQRITLNVCKILRKKGFSVTLLSVDDRFGNIKKHFEDHVDEIKHIKSHPVLLKYGDEDSWFKGSNFLKSVFLGLIPFYFRSLKLISSSKYDYLYCCDPRGATMMLVAAMSFKKVSILHFHGKNRLPGFLSKLFLRVFTYVPCVSKDVADSLPPSDNKSVVYNGIDFEQYEDISVDAVQEEMEKIIGDRANKTLFLYAGLFKPHKGIHHLIYAFSRLVKDSTKPTEPVLLICGAGKTPEEKNMMESLKQYCIEQGVDGNIIWAGWRSNILAWMKYANYFVFPTINKEENKFPGFGALVESTEGLPTVLIESSICGLYSIAANVTGVKEIISDNHNGIIFEPGEEDLLKRLQWVLENKPSFIDFPNRENFALTTFENQIDNLFR